MRASLILASICLGATPAAAYNLATSISRSCHEQLTVDALRLVAEQALAELELDVPDDAVLRKLLDNPPEGVGEITDEGVRFAVFSVVVGVRSPDTEGHSTFDLTALRRLHADPDPVGQYAHALRGPDDDGLEGDLLAVAGTKRQIRREVQAALAAYLDDEIDDRGIYLDHYGGIEVPVRLGLYHIGRAIHILQDAHAHMLRSDDLRHVVHVMNYIDAVNGTLDRDRDGLAHSGALDDCTREDIAPIAELARARSGALTAAAFAFAVGGDPTLLDLGLSPCPDDATDPTRCGWVEYKPDCAAALVARSSEQIDAVCCTQANDYCDSKWLPIAKKKPAGPYLGCATGPTSGPMNWLVLFAILVPLRRRAALALVCLATPAHAHDAFIATEGHFAVLNDRPDAAILDASFGYGLRGGYQLGDWRILAQVERNYWLRSEFDLGVDPGALNVGLGGEYLLFDGFIRVGLTLGASILMFDTQLDEAGTFGPYGELRPGGFRWALGDRWVITLDPIIMTGVFPVVREPRIRKIQRRTTAGLEFCW